MYPPRLRWIFSSLSPKRRLISSTSSHLSASPSTSRNTSPFLSQGDVTEPDQCHPQDTRYQAARADTRTPFDAAAPGKGLDKGWQFRPPKDASGNWEGLGFADQVGSASASASASAGRGAGNGAGKGMERGSGGEVDGESEETRASGVIPSMKQALGLGTKVGELKRN